MATFHHLQRDYPSSEAAEHKCRTLLITGDNQDMIPTKPATKSPTRKRSLLARVRSIRE
jgi:hypothetical protein